VEVSSGVGLQTICFSEGAVVVSGVSVKFLNYFCLMYQLFDCLRRSAVKCSSLMSFV
jgi:hypothetical protein